LVKCRASSTIQQAAKQTPEIALKSATGATGSVVAAARPAPTPALIPEAIAHPITVSQTFWHEIADIVKLLLNVSR
jgi:hypothetical protein